MAYNDNGLLPAVEFKNFSGAGPQQILLLLMAEPARCRLAANRVLPAVLSLAHNLPVFDSTRLAERFMACRLL